MKCERKGCQTGLSTQLVGVAIIEGNVRAILRPAQHTFGSSLMMNMNLCKKCNDELIKTLKDFTDIKI